MNWTTLKSQLATSPAFLFDEDQLEANLKSLANLRAASACKILYSIKALPLRSVLDLLISEVDGFSVSSLFEARLAKAALGSASRSLHLTTPGLRPDEFAELAALCSHISFNSLSQYQRLREQHGGYSQGLRVNPKLSFATDPRYDPCRLHSKLGVDIECLQDGLPVGIEGLHFHTVFAHPDFQPLQQTLEKLLPVLQRANNLRWLNLGGGYLYPAIADHRPLLEWIRRLRQEFGLDVYLEPGKALVGNAGYLLTTVLDSFVSDGQRVLVLDTSVNHNPEVFEYQRKPRLLEECPLGSESAILTGCSCLAGDVFGEYRFEQIPQVGDRLVFSDVGAYSLIKASRFNGYNLPDVYMMSQGQSRLAIHHDFDDFRRQWSGVNE